jgi:hypothetical protein
MANLRNTYRSFVGDIYFKNITFSDKLFTTSSLLLFIITGKIMSQTDRQTDNWEKGGGNLPPKVK